MAEDLYDTLKATAIAHIRAFESTSGPTGSPFDPENVYAWRTPDCVMRFHPASGMSPPFDGPITIKEHRPACLILGAVMESLQVDIHEISVDVKTRTVAARTTMNYIFKPVRDDPRERPYPIEYVWITEMDESGGKIVRMEECLDTVRAGYMLERAQKYAAEHSQYM